MEAEPTPIDGTFGLKIYQGGDRTELDVGSLDHNVLQNTLSDVVMEEGTIVIDGAISKGEVHSNIDEVEVEVTPLVTVVIEEPTKSKSPTSVYEEVVQSATRPYSSRALVLYI